MCSILGCKNNSISNESNVKLFGVPSIEKYQKTYTQRTVMSKRRQKWIEILENSGLNNENVDSFKVCQNHFVNKRPAPVFYVNDIDWAPSRNLNSKLTKTKQECDPLESPSRLSTRKRFTTTDKKHNSDFVFVDIDKIVHDKAPKQNFNPLINARNSMKNKAVQTDFVDKNCDELLSLGGIIAFIREQVLNYILNASGTKYKLKYCNFSFEKQNQESYLKEVCDEISDVKVEMSRLKSSDAFLLKHVQKCLQFHGVKKYSLGVPRNYSWNHTLKNEHIVDKTQPVKCIQSVEQGNFSVINKIDDDDAVLKCEEESSVKQYTNMRKRKNVDTFQEILGTKMIPRVELTRLPENLLQVKDTESQENVTLSMNDPENNKSSQYLLVPHSKKKHKKLLQNQQLTGYLLVSKTDPNNMMFLPKNNDIIPNASKIPLGFAAKTKTTSLKKQSIDESKDSSENSKTVLNSEKNKANSLEKLEDNTIYEVGNEKNLKSFPRNAKLRCCYCLKICNGSVDFLGHFNEIGCRGGKQTDTEQNTAKQQFEKNKKYPDCNICGRIFMKNDYLAFHVKTHEEYNEWTMECEQCPKKFPNNELLIEHSKEWHPNENTIGTIRKVFCRSCSKMLPFDMYRANHLKKCEGRMKAAKKVKKDDKPKEIIPQNITESISFKEALPNGEFFDTDQFLNGPTVKITKIRKSIRPIDFEHGSNEVTIEEIDSE